jgi:lipoyl(octanoyl) transferase
VSRELGVVGLGRMTYAEALDLQRSLAQKRIDGGVDRDLLLLVEHNPVVTLGRGAKDSSMPLPSAEIAARGVELFEVDRGGDVTFHGPGQLVGYPIFDLAEHQQDLHWFLRRLESALITALGELGVPAERNEGRTGVWTRGRKIASLGIHVKRWVTWHGFALNVTTDLSYFDLIVPCGIPGVEMTSVQKELGERAPRDLWSRSLDSVILGFADAFQQTPQALSVEDLPPATLTPVPSP